MDAPPDPRNAPSIPSPAAVAKALPGFADKTVITYAAFSDGIAVWVYDDRGIYSHWVAVSPSDFRNQATKLQRLCSDPMSDLSDLRATARSLYDLLIRPVQERLQPTRTLLIEPDESMYVIPWEVLLNETGHYLAEQFSIALTPGLYRTTRLHPSHPIDAALPALIVSVPVVPDERLPRLVDADSEAEAITGMFPRSIWLRGPDASISAIRSELKGKAVFHFSGHADVSIQRNGLLLANTDPATKTPEAVSRR